MNRRTYLAATGTVGIATLGGCVADSDDESNNDSDNESDNGDEDGETGQNNDSQMTPTEVIEEYNTAWKDGDAERAQELYHSESSDTEDIVWDEFGKKDDGYFETEELTLVETTEETRGEKTDEVAIVEEKYVWENPEVGKVRDLAEWELRKEDGDWKLWEWELVETLEVLEEPEGPEGNTPAPNPTLEYDVENGNLEIAVTGGDSFEAQRVTVEYEDGENSATGTWDELGDADSGSTISAGDELLIGDGTGSEDFTGDIQEDWEVKIVWESQDGETTSVISTMSAP